MAGLMANNYDRYCAEYPPEDNKEEFALAFVKANLMKQDEVNKAFDTAINLPSFTSTAAMSFFLSIRGKLDEERKVKCEELVLDLLNGDTTPYVTPLCNWMFMEQEVTAFEEECVLSLIKGLFCTYKSNDLRTYCPKKQRRGICRVSKKNSNLIIPLSGFLLYRV